MPTTASSNNPHVRLTRDTHEKIRLLSFLLRITQGELIEQLASEKLRAMGNPRVSLGPRQKKPGEKSAVAGLAADRALPTAAARSAKKKKDDTPARRRTAAAAK